MHHETREFLRSNLQRDIAALVANLQHIGDVVQLTETLNSIRKMTLFLQDLMTHDAMVAEELPETRAARALYAQVMKRTDAVRDLEILLGTGEHANSGKHNFIRELRQFAERQRTREEAERGVDHAAIADAAKAVAARSRSNGGAPVMRATSFASILPNAEASPQ